MNFIVSAAAAVKASIPFQRGLPADFDDRAADFDRADFDNHAAGFDRADFDDRAAGFDRADFDDRSAGINGAANFARAISDRMLHAHRPSTQCKRATPHGYPPPGEHRRRPESASRYRQQHRPLSRPPDRRDQPGRGEHYR